uniref:Peptidase M16 N-terminal domain-containing protein n=1 Tax=Macaca fascicularis TaxID=9541 RepID=A0A7N9D8L9_MACFA
MNVLYSSHSPSLAFCSSPSLAFCSLFLPFPGRSFFPSVQFGTTPMDSTGVPHILEHTILCGSRKYPCRDPFFKMLNRSLSTFMNAFTGLSESPLSVFGCHLFPRFT